MTISHDDLKAILNDLVDRGVVALTLPNGERIELGQRARDSAPPADGDAEGWLTREQLEAMFFDLGTQTKVRTAVRMALAAIALRDCVLAKDVDLQNEAAALFREQERSKALKAAHTDAINKLTAAESRVAALERDLAGALREAETARAANTAPPAKETGNG